MKSTEYEIYIEMGRTLMKHNSIESDNKIAYLYYVPFAYYN